MRKSFKLITLIFIIVISVFALTACNKKGKNEVDLNKNISYAETHKFAGLNENFRVSVTSGMKEKLFIADGKATDVNNFSTISVMPLKNNLQNKSFTFTLLFDGGEISGSLSRDIVTHNYTADIDLGENVDKIISVKILYDDKSEDIALENKLNGAITYKKVLLIAATEFSEQINANVIDGELPREICIKFIKDKRNPDSPYYWYISFIAADNSYWALLLEPLTGEIITKKA